MRGRTVFARTSRRNSDNLTGLFAGSAASIGGRSLLHGPSSGSRSRSASVPGSYQSPVKSRKKTTPSEYTSDAALASPPFLISRARYPPVPMTSRRADSSSPATTYRAPGVRLRTPRPFRQRRCAGRCGSRQLFRRVSFYTKSERSLSSVMGLRRTPVKPQVSALERASTSAVTR